MTIRTMIVDDEVLARDLVRQLLSVENDVQVVAECTNGKDALAAIRTEKPQLLFLDVQMPGLSGIEMLRRLDPGCMPYVVFVTAYDRYAIQAFEVRALDYLLKPLQRERFAAAVAQARETIRQNGIAALTQRLVALVEEHGLDAKHVGDGAAAPAAEHLEIRDGRRLFAIPFDDIAWIESANQYVKIHTRDRQHMVARSMAALEGILPKERFVRIHRSTIVNADCVDQVRTTGNGTHEVALDDGTRLGVSRSRRGALQRILKRG